jgi:hypothetical protein
MDSAPEFFNKLRQMGIEPEFVSSPLLKIYIACGEIPYERGSEKGIRLSHWNYPKEVEDALFRDFKLIDRHYLGTGENLTRFWELTEKGWEIAESIFNQHLELNRSKVDGVLSSFPPKLLLIIALSCSKREGLSYLPEAVNTATAQSLSDFLHKIEFHLAFATFDDAAISRWSQMGFKKSCESGEIADRELSIVCEKFPLVFAKFMVQHPLIQQPVEKFLKELVSNEAAIKIAEYGAKGQPLGEAYKAPQKILSLIWSRSEKEDVSREMNTFAMICVFLKNLQSDFTIRRLKFFVNSLGLSESIIENELELMHKEGATSKYLNSGDDEDRAFIRLNDEKYSSHLRLALNMLARQIIES